MAGRAAGDPARPRSRARAAAGGPHAGLRRGHAAWDDPGTGRLPRGSPGGSPGRAVKTIRWLVAGLLLLSALLGALLALLALLAYEGYIIYQLIAGASLIFSATLVLVHLASFAASRIPRWDIATASWYSMGKVAAGAGLLVRAIASQSGWGHPLLFAIISYCGYAMSAACLGVAVVLLARSLPRSSARAVTEAGNQARSG